MNLSDNDLELFLQIYDKALAHIQDKNKDVWAKDFILTLEDYGVDLKRYAMEIGDHDDYLGEAIENFFEEYNEDLGLDDDYDDEDIEDYDD